jgi:hypothetical protein
MPLNVSRAKKLCDSRFAPVAEARNGGADHAANFPSDPAGRRRSRKRSQLGIIAVSDDESGVVAGRIRLPWRPIRTHRQIYEHLFHFGRRVRLRLRNRVCREQRKHAAQCRGDCCATTIRSRFIRRDSRDGFYCAQVSCALPTLAPRHRGTSGVAGTPSPVAKVSPMSLD